jgi:hypothetical protein
MRRPMRLLGSAGCLLVLALGSSCGGGVVPMVSRDISVQVTPASVTIPPGAVYQFNSKVNGTQNASVQWSVSGASCSSNACGAIDMTGLYTAPATIPTPSRVSVIATSQVDATKSGSSAVTIGSSGFLAPKITTLFLPDGTVGLPYDVTVVGVGIPPFGWNTISGMLPPGLALSCGFPCLNASIHGTPTTSGSYDFTIQLWDDTSPPRSDQKAFTLKVN